MLKRTTKLLRPAEKALKDSERQYKDATSLALKNMMAEAYFKMKSSRFQTEKVNDDYLKRLKILKNKLSSERN